MRILKTLLIGLLFINCTSQAKEPVYTYELSKELQPYVFEYLSTLETVSYTHFRAHEIKANHVCRLLLEIKHI